MLTMHWKVAYTGRWSENLRGAELYDSCLIFVPFRKIRSVQAGMRAFSLWIVSCDGTGNTSRKTYDVSYLSVPTSNLYVGMNVILASE